MDDDCHCPPTDHAPTPCEQPQDSSWDTAHHCHPPCSPPPCEQDDYFFWNNPALLPAFHPYGGASCTVRVEKPAAGDGRAPLLERKAGGGAFADDPYATDRTTHVCIVSTTISIICGLTRHACVYAD